MIRSVADALAIVASFPDSLSEPERMQLLGLVLAPFQEDPPPPIAYVAQLRWDDFVFNGDEWKRVESD